MFKLLHQWAWGKEKAMPATTRYYELDLLRGIAVIAMVFFNTLLISWYIMEPYRIDNNMSLITMLPWAPLLINLGQCCFYIIAGICFHLRYSQKVYRNLKWAALRIGTKAIGALAVTLFTTQAAARGWIYQLPSLSTCVYFGSLHCITACSILLFFLIGLPTFLLIFASSGLIIIGLHLERGALSNAKNYLDYCVASCQWGTRSMDYFPIIPWLGVILLGVILGRWLYPSGQPPRFVAWRALKSLTAQGLCYVGRHALLIYVLHIPVIRCAIFGIQKFF